MENTKYNIQEEGINYSVKKYTNEAESRKWILIHNGVDVYHPAVLYKNGIIETIQPHIEVFDSREEAEAAFPNLEWRPQPDEMEKMSSGLNIS